MGADLYETHPRYREVFDRASAVLGYDLAGLCLQGPEEELAKTEFTQPAVVVTSLAMLAVVEEEVEAPAFVAGHSLGEYTACVAAGVLSLEDCLGLVAERARLMEAAAGKRPGCMVAVLGMAGEAVEKVVEETDGAWVANYNSPGQVVVSAGLEYVERISDSLNEAGAKRVVRLPVGGGFHSPLMEEAVDPFRVYSASVVFGDAVIPIVLNGTAEAVTDGETIGRSLAVQLTGPVRWEESVRWMVGMGVGEFYEIGPGDVLTKLNKRIVPEATCLSTRDYLKQWA